LGKEDRLDRLLGWLLLTTFPDIAILLADLLVGLALYKVIIVSKQ
jgi:hypothetical protein